MASLLIPTSNFHELNESVVRQQVPECSAVYLLKVQMIDGSWKYFHVGQTQNLRSRLLKILSGNVKNTDLQTKLMTCNCGLEYTVMPSQKYAH